ncbi:MAG TPA: acetate--CoA ligase family protein [Ramlibacter sp.]|nr:acetate--CoA ligase family protein [Ramlibacter sp.]
MTLFMSDLSPLFRPRSVAIVGASSDPNKVGGRPLAFLRKAGWTGRILPVNPQGGEVQGVPAFRSLDEIAEPIDQAIIAVPAAQVLATAQQCLAKGARALQVFSAGFGEGAGAADAQARLKAMAAQAGARVLGPNSLGLFNAADGFFGTFATALDGAWPARGGVGVATQSGAFGSYFFGMAQARGLGFSHFVATGNEADVDVADCVRFLAEDPATHLIVMAVEGCQDGRKLAAALQAARAAGKPVLAMKVGVSQAGAQAAATHTGSLSGEDRVIDAVFRQAGAWRADSLQALVDAAYVASVGPMPRGRRLLVVTTSGGIGVLGADAAEAAHLELPPIGDGALAGIRNIAALADGRNPVDTSAGILGDLSAYARIAAHALRDREYDAVLCYLAHVPRNPSHWAQLREALYALREEHAGKAFALVALADEGIVRELETRRIAHFVDPTAAVRAIAACAPRGEGSSADGGHECPPYGMPGELGTEAQAKAALAAHGIAFAPERVVRDADQAVAAARELGYPVVLKIVSADIAHKTEAGGVALDLRDEAALRAAVAAMDRTVRERVPLARLDGFLVARQLRGGVEVLVGTQCDPAFGPVVTVGAGGVLAELLDDVCVRLAPVTQAEALAMLEQLRIAPLLRGWRGAPAADLPALAHQVALLSRIAWSNRDRIASIDLNPVLALPGGAYAVDALIHPAGGHNE